MYITKKLRLFFLVLTAGAFWTAGCSKMEDLYKEPEAGGPGLFPDGAKIPSDFKWSSVKSVDVQIAVDDKFGGQYFYRIELFDADPMSGQGANLLGAGQAKQGQDFVGKIVVPTALRYVYLRQTSPVGVPSLTMLEVADVTSLHVSKSTAVRSLSASVGRSTYVPPLSSALRASSASGAGRMAATASAPTVPADAQPISGSGWVELKENTSYVIAQGATFTGSVGFKENAKLYVQGTFENAGMYMQLGKGTALYVLQGGKVHAQAVTQSETGLFVNYGATELQDLRTANVTLYENYGTLKVGNANFDNGSFSNHGTATFESLTGTTETTLFLNTGKLTVNREMTVRGGASFKNTNEATIAKLHGSNAPTLIHNDGVLIVTERLSVDGGADVRNSATGVATVEELATTTPSCDIVNEGGVTVRKADIGPGVLWASCHTVIETLNANSGSVFHVADGARLQVATLNATGATFNLAASAILDVSGTATFTNGGTNVIQGTGTGMAVARLTKVALNKSDGALRYAGNVEVACSDHETNGQWNTYYTVSSPAAIVPYDKSTVQIAATACNAGGNNAPGSGGNPGDQTVVEVPMGTYSYAFEDNWPSLGDYDMNDFVVDMAITKFQNTANRVTKVVLKGKLRSVGASRRMAAALQLDGVPAENVKSVTYSRVDLIGSNVPLGSNGAEAGQTYAVVAVADDVHSAFGIADTRFISTLDGSYSPVEVEIAVEFHTPLEHFTYNTLNPFVITFGQHTGGRNEIHLAGYTGTNKINTSLIARERGNGLSADDPFKTPSGEPWALCVPVSFGYPKEGVNIKEAYPRFAPWATSGGTQETDWYLEKR